jgi:hypothetical protein
VTRDDAPAVFAHRAALRRVRPLRAGRVALKDEKWFEQNKIGFIRGAAVKALIRRATREALQRRGDRLRQAAAGHRRGAACRRFPA